VRELLVGGQLKARLLYNVEWSGKTHTVREEAVVDGLLPFCTV